MSLAAGEVIQEFGGYEVYGVADNMDTVRRERLLPVGLAIGCRLRRAIAKDAPLGLDDILVPERRTVDLLYLEQERHFAPSTKPLPHFAQTTQ